MQKQFVDYSSVIEEVLSENIWKKLDSLIQYYQKNLTLCQKNLTPYQKNLILCQKNLTLYQKNLAPLKNIWHLSKKFGTYQKKLTPIRKN